MPCGTRAIAKPLGAIIKVKKRTAQLILVLLISACSQINEESKSNTNHSSSEMRQSQDSFESKDNTPKNDPIRSASEYHQLVLDSGKLLHHSNDNIVLSIIDSLKSSNDLAFHFLVFTKSLNGSDGYYAEGAGHAAYNFVLNETISFASFFATSDRINKDDFSNWASAVLGEIQIAFENQEQDEVERLTSEIQKNIQESNEVNRSVINAFVDELNFQMQERIEKTAPNKRL